MNQFRIYVTQEALAEIKDLPGKIRQRIRQSIKELARQPQPSHSKKLQFDDPDRQLFRIRLDNWRIVMPSQNLKISLMFWLCVNGLRMTMVIWRN